LQSAPVAEPDSRRGSTERRTFPGNGQGGLGKKKLGTPTRGTFRKKHYMRRDHGSMPGVGASREEDCIGVGASRYVSELQSKLIGMGEDA